MKQDDVKKQVRHLVSEILEVEGDTLSDDAQFVKDLGMDSMMALEILASIEKKFKIVVPEESLVKFTDINKTTEIVSGLLKK